jgi:hypothetical protein
MRWMGRALGALAGVLLCVASAQAGELASASDEVRGLVQWVSANRDHGGRPFAVVDKKGARLYVFDARGRLAGSTPALLGAALGDRSVPGIGRRPVDEILPHERTTPAGRFDSEPGRNLTGEHVVWVDYHDGVAIHRLRPGASYAPRVARLASGGGEDNRVSLGCIVVPGDFYDAVVRPVLGDRRGVVYVLPDTEPLQQVFGNWSAG